ncbi:CoA transferase [Streptomyces niveiscabiei]|uniref:CoA transferase n=1 Tax=Streptomyces niveiscabiei TaxID=164115 RepID=UPI0029B3C43B|nr:CoA transferase [Streptomyces niveiscabiei]MDX3384955.1 CoA transferase [Streptomyces niveiscabiei]
MIDTAVAWDALGGDPALAAGVSVTARDGVLPSRLPVRELARACVAVCSLAAAELSARRAGATEVPGVRVDDGAVAAAFVSERHLLVGGRAPVTFAPLSRFWRTGDGWVRTHANYPHHRERLLRGLGVPSGEPDTVAAALAERSAVEVEEAVYGAGGLAVALRTRAEWERHPQAVAVGRRPLVEWERLGEAGVYARGEKWAGGGSGAHAREAVGGQAKAHARRRPVVLPAAGLRVLDLTRVIAGPVATRTLALLGADVLRVDAPQLAELPDQHADTGFGKRSALVDLAADREVFEGLLASADVVVTGYRPGALDRFGLSPEALAERRPGVIVAQLSAWGAYGPWSGRRGFDSLVQAASGIADTEGDGERPGALPAQALDHGTGYLLAAGVLRAVTERDYGDGYGRVLRLALARTARWLTEGGDGAGGGSGGGPGPGVGQGIGDGPAHEAGRGTEDDPGTGAEHNSGGSPGPGAGHGTGGGTAPRAGHGTEDSPGPGAGHSTGDGPAPGDGQGSGGGPGAEPWLAERDSPLGRLRYARSPVEFEGGPVDWERPPGRWGADEARWV